MLPAWQSAAYNLSLGRTAPLQTWGVSDRPMYRSGETVRYRLWQRQRSVCCAFHSQKCANSLPT